MVSYNPVDRDDTEYSGGGSVFGVVFLISAGGVISLSANFVIVLIIMEGRTLEISWYCSQVFVLRFPPLYLRNEHYRYLLFLYFPVKKQHEVVDG